MTKPISSAPKDGTLFIGYEKDSTHPIIVRWEEAAEDLAGEERGYFECVGYCCNDFPELLSWDELPTFTQPENEE